MTAKRFTNHDDTILDTDGEQLISTDEIVDTMNELHEEVMDLRRENTKFKLVVREIIEDMQKYVDDNQLVYINQSYVDWIKKEVDTTLYSQKEVEE